MKKLKITGRERSVLRVLDFSTGNTGEELLASSRLEPEDLVDVINGLMSPGYLEVTPSTEETTVETFREARFDINPSYSQELRAVMANRY